MKARTIFAFAAVIVLVTAALGQESGAAKKKAPKSAATPIFMPAADLKWTDLDPKGAPGVKIADLWGNHAKGAYGAITKFPAGFVAPLHTHTTNMKIVVISGTFISTPEGKPDVRLGPGSYFMQPGGNYRHTSACDKASECVFFIEQNAKFDIKPVEAAKK